MIPEAFIVEWSSKVNWPIPEQVEQDLVLSQLITDFANDHKIDEFIELAGAELGEAFEFDPLTWYYGIHKSCYIATKLL